MSVLSHLQVTGPSNVSIAVNVLAGLLLLVLFLVLIGIALDPRRRRRNSTSSLSISVPRHAAGPARKRARSDRHAGQTSASTTSTGGHS